MAARLVIYRLEQEKALIRERVLRDHTNPLDIFSDSVLVERFRFDKQTLFEIIDELVPLLRLSSERNRALSPTLQMLITLRIYANGAFQLHRGKLLTCVGPRLAGQ